MPRVALLVALCALVLSCAGNLGVAETAQENCQSVNGIYAKERQRAAKNFRDLRRNARVLGIHLSPEAISIAYQQMIVTQRNYKNRECPLFPHLPFGSSR